MRRTFLGVMLLLGGAVGYACGFPDVEFAAGSDGGVREGSSDAPPPGTSSSSSTGGTSGTSGTSGQVEPGPRDGGKITIIIDGSVLDADVDAGGKVEFEAGTECTLCDCDGDGYLGGDAGCNPPAGMEDCDDFDSRTHPGAGPYPIPAEPPRFGDWNCSGLTEKVPPDVFSCGALNSALLVGGCTNYAGFTKAMQCGEVGTYVTCKDPLLGLGACVTDLIGEATQPCQ